MKYISYRLVREVTCDCSAYSHVHRLGVGHCQNNEDDDDLTPRFANRGLTGRFRKILRSYTDCEEEVINEFLKGSI
jgi:hypothetical protein